MVRATADGRRVPSARADSAVPRDQAGDDGHVHLPGLRGDVLRQPVRVVLLPVRLAPDLAAHAAPEHAGVLRQLAGHPRAEHGDPAFERWALPLHTARPAPPQWPTTF